MRVLHLCRDSRNVGNGTVNLAVTLATGQAAAGATVGFLHARGGFAELLEARGVATFRAGEAASVDLGPNAALGTRRAIRAFEPDVVHSHMGVNCLLTAAVRPFCPRFRTVATVHRQFSREAAAMRLADHAVAISDSDRRNLLARGFRPGRVTRIHNGTLGFDPTLDGAGSADADVRLRSPSVLTVAGMNHRKGIADLIAAIDLVRREIPEVHLYLAGHGSERALFEAMAVERGLEATVTFLGFRADPRPLYPQADVFVLASRAEPFGLALLEARAAGCAIIGTEVDGIPEVLAGGAAGRLVPPRDPERLAAAITALLRDGEARAALGRAARSGLDYWSVARMVDETLALYDRLAA